MPKKERVNKLRQNMSDLLWNHPSLETQSKDVMVWERKKVDSVKFDDLLGILTIVCKYMRVSNRKEDLRNGII